MQGRTRVYGWYHQWAADMHPQVAGRDRRVSRSNPRDWRNVQMGAHTDQMNVLTAPMGIASDLFSYCFGVSNVHF